METSQELMYFVKLRKLRFINFCLAINGNFVVNGFVLDIIRCFINGTIENIP
jgi:hypothetical protein